MHHEFTPTHYHTTIGPHESVLKIRSGDSVSTTTVDAGGRDKEGCNVTEGGNPQTGPFFVEGTKPGDTLANLMLPLNPHSGCFGVAPPRGQGQNAIHRLISLPATAVCI